MSLQIDCSDLVKIFSAEGVEVQALQGLTLRVDRGELTAIVGASGSGKSTLLSILTGLEIPTAGRATVAGHDLLTMTAAERTRYRRETVGFVWQQTSRNLLPYYTATQNIAMPLALAGMPRRRRAERVSELVELLGMGDFAGRRPMQLSGGQQQRVAIARAIVTRPAVLLADEPTGNLDTHTGEEIMELISALNRDQGITVLMVTHEPDMAAHAKRVIRFVDGKVDSDRRNEEAD